MLLVWVTCYISNCEGRKRCYSAFQCYNTVDDTSGRSLNTSDALPVAQRLTPVIKTVRIGCLGFTCRLRLGAFLSELVRGQAICRDIDVVVGLE